MHRALHDVGRAAVIGPWGSGKSTLLRTIAREAADQGRPTLFLNPHPDWADQAYSGLGHLLTLLKPGTLDSLAEQPRTHLEQLLPWNAAVRPSDPTQVRTALTSLFASLTQDNSVLLLIDNAQWLDPASIDALAHQTHAFAPQLLHTVAAERTATGPRTAWHLCGHHTPVLPLTGLSVDQTADLLDAQSLPVRSATHVHHLTGGNPALTQALLTDLATRRDGLTVHPLATRAATHWLQEISPSALPSLRFAALTDIPLSSLLRCCTSGNPDLESHLLQAETAGILTMTADGVPLFTAGLLQEATFADLTHDDLRSLHQTLADALDDPAQAVRHRLLALDAPDEATAAEAEQAGALARSNGERDLAADLLLLAAEHTPADARAERLRRLAIAATDAVASGRAEVAHRVHQAITAARPGAEERVTALLSILDTGGQALHELDDILARARQAAQGDPALQARVELRAAIRANIGGLGAKAARDAARAAVEFAEQTPDRLLRATALTQLARMQRTAADPAAADTLDRALALDVPVEDTGVRASPQYLAAWFAVHDDRLHEARERLAELLAVAEHNGDTGDLELVLRTLAEVAARSGQAAKAVTLSERVIALCAEAEISLGPPWYTASMAQAAGGSFHQALLYARQGLAVARDEHDAIFIPRNLFALAVVQRISGDPRAAVENLREVGRLQTGWQIGDPRILPWQPELAEALAADGDPHAGGQVLDELLERFQGTRILTGSLGAATTRARALCAAHRGEIDTAIGLLDDAAAHFAALGLVLDQGRTLVSLGRLERGRRRPAAARTVWQEAKALFHHAQARPWISLCEDLLNRLHGAPRDAATGTATAVGELTESERRLAALVAEGASNREAAAHLFLSVKTVEAMLSRIYRKLGIRSRTQLARALPPAGGPLLPPTAD
ncbi:LuxR family transcriptional regulator [Streptomyces litmocidini]|uniref:LuxR family transcriptional regulator n=1 Tax=Streptomyces litmocidini TaxID=67318 RepID=UPI0034084068